jgi:sterol-4alpha-carboxylate 3-dehydrogenase (decarboxylating)
MVHIAEDDCLLEKEHLVLTGGSGFVGGHIVHALRSSFPNLRITVLDLSATSASHGDLGTTDDLLSFQSADVVSASSVESAFKALSVPPTIVVHTAGIVPTGNERYLPSDRTKAEVWKVNVGGTENVLKAAKDSGVKAFVYTGSCTVITDDNFHDYPNMNEKMSTIGEAMIYGKSKVSQNPLSARSLSAYIFSR